MLRGFAAVLLCAIGCGGSHDPSGSDAAVVLDRGAPRLALPGVDVPVALVASSQFSGFHDPARLVLRTRADWAAAWATWSAPCSSPAPLPEVDFDREVVVLAAAGERHSGGFTMTIPNASEDDGSLRIAAVESRPGPQCVTTTVMSQPVSAVRMPRPDRPVRFVDAVVQVSCD